MGTFSKSYAFTKLCRMPVCSKTVSTVTIKHYVFENKVIFLSRRGDVIIEFWRCWKNSEYYYSKENTSQASEASV